MGPFADLSTLQSAAPSLLLALNVGIGLAGGFVVGRRRALQSSSDRPSLDDTRQNSEEAKQTAAAEASIERLEALATHMTDRVAHHNERVEAINLTLAHGSAAATQSQVTVADAATKLLDANGRLQAELQEARQALAEQSERLHTHRREALTDALTGLYNRRAFDQELQAQVTQVPGRRPLDLLMMIDIDHFKQVNDRFGHQQGDLVLQQVAGVLREASLEADGFAARYGGEEFALLWPACDEKATAEGAERVRHAVESLMIEGDRGELRVTISIGCAHLNAGDTRDTVVQHADSALYAAKRAGRNRVVQQKDVVHHKNHNCMPPAHDEEPMATVRGPTDLSARRAPEPEPAATPAIERRQHSVRAFTGTHWIAPHLEGDWPSDDSFQPVQGIDVSAGGFSFSCEMKPTCQSFVVRFNVSGEVRYLLARITNCGPHTGHPSRFRVGCQFLGRLEPGASERHAVKNGSGIEAEDLAALSQPESPEASIV